MSQVTQPRNSSPSPASAAALLMHEDAATSAAGTLDAGCWGSAQRRGLERVFDGGGDSQAALLVLRLCLLVECSERFSGIQERGRGGVRRLFADGIAHTGIRNPYISMGVSAGPVRASKSQQICWCICWGKISWNQ